MTDFRLTPPPQVDSKPRPRAKPRREAPSCRRCWGYGWVTEIVRDSDGLPGRLLVGECPDCGGKK